jgi:hypothetical protein
MGLTTATKSRNSSRRRVAGVATGSRRRVAGIAIVITAIVLAGAPRAAQAHGPINPSASSFLARPTEVPAGVEAKAVDGDLRLWVQVSPSLEMVVLDYRGAPYVRFSRAGVEVNQNSAMYYLNQTPAEIPPTGLGPTTPPKWHRVTGGHEYEWHDGRLHALGTTVIAPGARYLGRWEVPVRIDGRTATIAGGLYYRPNPPLVWFWPIVVVLACVFAGLRLRRPELDRRVARGLAFVALTAFALAAVGQGLHGRPGVAAFQLVVLAFELAFVVWGLRWLLLGRQGWFALFLIAGAAIYEGATLVEVLLRGFVLIALPALVARLTVATCLASGVGLVPLVFRIAPQPGASGSDEATDDELDWEDEGLLA